VPEVRISRTKGARQFAALQQMSIKSRKLQALAQGRHCHSKPFPATPRLPPHTTAQCCLMLTARPTLRFLCFLSISIEPATPSRLLQYNWRRTLKRSHRDPDARLTIQHDRACAKALARWRLLFTKQNWDLAQNRAPRSLTLPSFSRRSQTVKDELLPGLQSRRGAGYGFNSVIQQFPHSEWKA
jgi:hypothetical protein